MKNEPTKTGADMKMYKKGSKWWKAIILTVVSGLETPFNTGTEVRVAASVCRYLCGIICNSFMDRQAGD